MRKEKKIDKGLIYLGIILLIVLVAGSVLYLQLRVDEITRKIEKDENINVLFLVSDKDELLFSEVFLYKPGTHKGAIFYVPANTGEIIQSLGRIDGIEAVYNLDGPESYQKQVEDLLQLSIDFYMNIDIEDVGRVVDLLKGLNVFVANPVSVVDEDEIMLLPSGSLVLDGDKILSYLEFEEETETESDSIYRKQTFFQSLLVSFKEKNDFVLSDQVFSMLNKFIQTDLNLRAFNSFLTELSQLQTERLVFQKVLGVNRVVDGKTLLFPHYEGRLVKQTVKQVENTIMNTDEMSDENLNIKIAILNGTSRNGLASRTSEIFSSFGFEIVKIENADTSNYPETVIIDNRGNTTAAARAADIIRCEKINPALESQEGSEADVILILGEDFDGRYCN